LIFNKIIYIYIKIENMAQSIIDTYNAKQQELGVDKISFAAGQQARTPYTTDDLKKADDQVLNAAKFKTGRGGDLPAAKYSDTNPK
jgi:hypothetical protein